MEPNKKTFVNLSLPSFSRKKTFKKGCSLNLVGINFKPFFPGIFFTWGHRDKTRVQLPAKNISSFESKKLAVYGPKSWFGHRAKKQFFDQIWCFLQLKQDSDNIIHS
jgi:hypothetical protein